MNYNDFIKSLHTMQFIDSVASTYKDLNERCNFYIHIAAKCFTFPDKLNSSVYSFCMARAVQSIINSSTRV